MCVEGMHGCGRVRSRMRKKISRHDGEEMMPMTQIKYE